MNNTEIVAKAKQFLEKAKIEHVPPGEIGDIDDKYAEVIFIVPLALQLGVTIDPPDVRVRVNLYTEEVVLIEQM